MPYDSIQRIGSIVINIKQGKVIEYLNRDALTMSPEVSSRWWAVDPIYAKFPSVNPYAFVNNTPIIAIDPDGRDIIFVNQKIGEKENAQITKQNFESIINTLYGSAKGKELIEYYLENPNENLYIAVGAVKNNNDGLGALGMTYTSSQEKNGVKTQVPFTKALIDATPELEEFKDAGVDETKNSALIVLDEKLYTEKNMDFYEQKDGGGSKGGAKVLGHEIGAHAKNAPEQYNGEGHTKWGQAVYEGKYKTGEGDAKALNTGVNKQRNEDKKSDLKLGSTSTNGVYKVGK